MVYDVVFRSLLRRLDAEGAHRAAFAALNRAAALPGAEGGARRVLGPSATARPVRALGLDFPGRLGLAAGFDKNAEGLPALAALGFSFVEVGTVTAQPQPGNPRPRLFRLVDDRALVNRMGFNNDGAEVVAARLRRFRLIEHPPMVVGVNIGKTKAVPDEEAIDDYVTSARLFATLADYLVVNVSSPNTPGLRDLQAVDRLRPLLVAVREALDGAGGAEVPLLVKIAPDLADDDVDAVADLAIELGLHGIIATNTTISREGLRSSQETIEAVGAGGLSGAPLAARSTEVLRRLRERAGAGLTLVAAGGIETPRQAWERVAAGATLVQAYSGFIYGGPLWPRRMNRGLERLTRSRGGSDA
ncbi:quinone-dependent dihydroorotate dehydrogenase [Spiractinospora alimapuensis]|uniref:quinone-dependent dihydroorotate dehydrogenase n=1 Tax=Spiractinospora alimapuensis TaxID=2820884 RepID=UPI001EEC2437|nr:quinone-dependent dihydroorotate dehydrogenase [Spiractinospora alimapuensis]QVQ52031.1 quinone-dependent dihydroorotate dehydrogenase [Spiractinospora alimapuensis]